MRIPAERKKNMHSWDMRGTRGRDREKKRKRKEITISSSMGRHQRLRLACETPAMDGWKVRNKSRERKNEVPRKDRKSHTFFDSFGLFSFVPTVPTEQPSSDPAALSLPLPFRIRAFLLLRALSGSLALSSAPPAAAVVVAVVVAAALLGPVAITQPARQWDRPLPAVLSTSMSHIR